MNKCPLMLKYKFRHWYNGQEVSYDPNTMSCIGRWTEFEVPRVKGWILQLHDRQNFIRNSNGDIQFFYRFDFHVAGNMNPILIEFSPTSLEISRNYSEEDSKVFLLPENCNIDFDFTRSKVKTVLQEYERYRDEWKTRVVVCKD